MSLQQYCVRWNNHLKVFQSALPQYFQSQKFLDCTLVAEGQHFVSCHRLVLDACSDYFANFLKNKMFDDKNIVICLPKEIKLWQIQALLQFMYHGEVCISQEGLPSLVKCAELLQVKGLCGSEQKTITGYYQNEVQKGKQTLNKQTVQSQMKSQNSSNGGQKTNLCRIIQATPNSNTNSSQTNQRNSGDNEENRSANEENGDLSDLMTVEVEIDDNDSTNGPFIKREIDISDIEDDDDPNSNFNNQTDGNEDYELNQQNKNSDSYSQEDRNDESGGPKKVGSIRVKNNIFLNSKKSTEVVDNSHTDSGIVFDNDSEGNVDFDCSKDGNSSKNNLIYNRNAMDVFIKSQNDFDAEVSETGDNDDSRYNSSPFLMETDSSNKQQFENIICAPNLLQYLTDSDNNESSNRFASSSNDDGMNQRFIINDSSQNASEISISEQQKESPFVIASVSSLNQFDAFKRPKLEHDNDAKMFQSLQSLGADEKASIGGLYLRNPRGNQIRQYDVNALYNALQDVKNGHSIYRAAQTYAVPRKTLRNWMKRLHIKSAYPMPRQLQAAAERKKIQQQTIQQQPLPSENQSTAPIPTITLANFSLT